MRRLADTFTEAFEKILWKPVRIEEGVGEGQVGAVLDSESRGKGSGAEVKVRVAHVLRVREGKVVWGKVYSDASEGLRAAGLEPES